MSVDVRDGVSASMLNQPIELDGARQALRDRLDLPGYPQVLLRLGYCEPGRSTPRRPVTDVLLDRTVSGTSL